jgi:hypothetical protein
MNDCVYYGGTLPRCTLGSAAQALMRDMTYVRCTILLFLCASLQRAIYLMNHDTPVIYLTHGFTSSAFDKVIQVLRDYGSIEPVPSNSIP